MIVAFITMSAEKTLVLRVVEAAIAQWVATQNAPEGQHTPAQRAMHPNGIDCVARARRVVATTRPDHRRNNSSIYVHRQQQHRRDGVTKILRKSVHWLAGEFEGSVARHGPWQYRLGAKASSSDGLVGPRLRGNQLAEGAPDPTSALALDEVGDVGSSDHDVV